MFGVFPALLKCVILESDKKLETLLIAPKVRQILHETAQRPPFVRDRHNHFVFIIAPAALCAVQRAVFSKYPLLWEDVPLRGQKKRNSIVFF